MTSINKCKKAHSNKHREEKEQKKDQYMEERVLKVEEAAEYLERTFDKIIAHINKEPVRVLSPPNPPAYTV